jgi:ATP-dependent helicase/nuclease subunit B
VTFSLPYDPEDPEPYAGTLRLLEELERAGEDSPLQEPPAFLPPDGPFTSLLFSRTPHTPSPVGLEFVEASTPADEVHWAIGAIRRLLEQGTSSATVAVLCRDMGRYAPLLEEVCRRYHVPFSTEQGPPLAASPLVHACLAPLYAARDRLDRQSLVELGTSTYLARHNQHARNLEVDRVLRDAGYLDETVCSPESAISRLVALRRRRGQSTDREESCLAALRPLLAAARSFARAGTLGNALALLSRYIDEFHLYRNGIGSGTSATVARDASAIASFQRIVEDLTADVSLLGMAAAATTPTSTISLLHQAMGGVSLSSRNRDAVSLLSFPEARGRRFDHVFIVGLNEGVCPARHPQHPLLTDADRQVLNGFWRRWRLLTSADRGKDEALLFRFAVSMAQKSLHLSCAAADEGGTPLLPSEYLEDILANPSFTLRHFGRQPAVPDLCRCTDQQELLSALLPIPATVPVRLAPLLNRIMSNGQRERERFTTPDMSSAACGPASGCMTRADILAELRRHFSTPMGNQFSPTLLEEYGRCPFRFFLHQLAGISPPQQLALDLVPAERGTLLHSLLQAFFEQAGCEGLLPLTGAAAETRLLERVADGVFARWEANHPLPHPLWQAEKRRALTLAASVIDAEAREASGLLPVAMEHRLSPLAVPSPDGSTIHLTGVMDRIDRSADGSHLRVVDYKLSRDKSRFVRLLKRDEMGVRSFQMPIYAAAAAKEFGQAAGAHCCDVTVRYWVIRGGCWEDARLQLSGSEGTFLDHSAEGMAQGGQENFFWRLWQVVEKMKGGHFAASPTECGFCPFTAICRLGN